MPKLNRVCFTCGSKHSYCPSCYEDRHLEEWHIMFDTENCKNVFNILNNHFYGRITTTVAINELEKCDLSIEFNEDIQKNISELLSQKQITKKKN